MYEAILGHAGVEFKVRSTPFPPFKSYIDQWTTLNANLVCFVTAIGYTVAFTNVASQMINERLSGLKHLQLISGMSTQAYWVGNFIFDAAKMGFIGVVTVICLFAYQI